jgi:hypothetical protein
MTTIEDSGGSVRGMRCEAIVHVKMKWWMIVICFVVVGWVVDCGWDWEAGWSDLVGVCRGTMWEVSWGSISQGQRMRATKCMLFDT